MNDVRSERDKMLAGEMYLSPDPELRSLITAARVRLRKFNDTPNDNAPARIAALKALLGRFGRSWIESPFTVDYGINVEIGDFCFVNMGCTFLDSNRIVLGDSIALGPNVQLITATHPVAPRERRIDYPADAELPMRAVGFALPIVIGDYCWIGAGAIVLPGVTIGAGTTIGAGSVVTRSIPPNVVAAGNPCRVIREIEPTGE